MELRVEEATSLSFADDEFDLATAIEVLEHVPEPEQTVAEMARVARSHLLVSVPREPLWRGLNMARGAYWRELGNTPGHVNHWSKRSFVSMLSPPRDDRGGPLALPVDHGACPPRISPVRLRPRRGHPLRGDRRHRPHHLRVLLAGLVRAGPRQLRRHHAAVVGGVRDGVGALPARRAAALAHDRRPRRPRDAGHRATCASRRTIQLGPRRGVRGRRRSRCAARSRTTCSAARARCTGCWWWRCWPTPPATSRAASSPGTTASSSTAGWCSWRPSRG